MPFSRGHWPGVVRAAVIGCTALGALSLCCSFLASATIREYGFGWPRVTPGQSVLAVAVYFLPPALYIGAAVGMSFGRWWAPMLAMAPTALLCAYGIYGITLCVPNIRTNPGYGWPSICVLSLPVAGLAGLLVCLGRSITALRSARGPGFELDLPSTGRRE
jgi:hypothetical protein